MQSQVAERDYREQSSNAEPVHGHGGVSLDALAGLASALELQQGTTRGGVWSLTGFDELEALEVAALEFMLVDSSSLDSGRAWSRPADKLSARPQDGQSKLGFESLNGGPVAFEDSERVSDLETVLVVLDSWLNEEQPHGQIEERQHDEQVRKFAGLASDQSRSNGNRGYESGSDNCVSSEGWSNDVHSAYYPSEINGSHKKCEETK